MMRRGKNLGITAMAHLWRAYLHNLHERPAIVKACTSCLTFTTTDVLAQWRERRKAPMQRHDLIRTAGNGLFGLLWLGPLNHVFWGRTIFGLEYWLPGPSWKMVFSRVAVDQMTVMPINMVAFLAWPHLLRGNIDAAIRNVRASFYDSATFALRIWPFVHPLSFRYVPLEHRLLVLNVCSLFVFSYATWTSERQQAAGRLKRVPTDPAAVAAAS